jgi:hypothetical protein
MNTRIFKLTAISSILMGAIAAHAAAPTADLTVKGTIGAPTCTVTTSNNGIYDFGRIAGTTIKAGTDTTSLAAISQPWTVTCDAATYLTFGAVDNRATSASSTATGSFGLGNVNGTGKLGYYTVTMNTPTVDGAAAYTYYTNEKTITGAAASARVYGGAYKNGWTASGTNTQKAGSVFGANLSVTPTLAGTTTMNGTVTDDTSLDGSLTLNFAFGL